MKFQVFFLKNSKRRLITYLIIVTIFLLSFISMPAYATLWGNKVDTQDLQRIITELRIYDDPDFPYYNDIFRLYYHDSKELLKALNNKIEITQQAMKILDADIKKEELGNLTYGRYILNAINEKELVEIGLKTGSPGQANGEYFSKLGENLADWKSQLNKFLLTKIIGATCTAMGAPALSIGISTLGLFCDLSIIKTNINKLNEVWYEKAFWSYMQFRNDHYFDHYDAWKGYAETQVKYILNLSLLSLEKQKKAREAIEENFKSLWNKYGDHIVNNKLDEDFKSQQRESLKILLLYVLGSEPHPIITFPLKITPPSPYQVGDIINAEFTIANRGTLPIKFSVLTVGGRDNDNQVADFSHRQNIILKPLESYNYQGTLNLNKMGDYHFFCTYQTPDDEWNTNVDVGSKLTDEDRVEDIYVKEKIVNQPPDPPANLAQFKSDGETKIPIGGRTDEHNVILKGKVNDPDGDKAKLEVELRRLNEHEGKFYEEKGGLQQSDLFENNSEIMIPIYGLADGDYHWRARAIDEHGLVSKWVSFGGNLVSDVDFSVGQLVVAPIITSPLKITPAPPYYYGDIISAEFTIANRNLFPITLNVLTVGGRDPDDQVADFTHRQNITIGPFEYYNYKGTLTLKKLGNFHFFCTYQTSDGSWNTNVDLGYGLTDEDRTKDIVVKVKEGQYIVPEISDKINIEWEKIFGGYGHDRAHSIVQKGDGGYLVTGIKGGRKSGENVWVFKLDERGGFEWDRIFGGKKDKYAYSITRTGDGGCAVLASGKRKRSVYLAKIDEKGNVKWDKTPLSTTSYGDVFNSRSYDYGKRKEGFIMRTKDGGYVLLYGTEVHRYTNTLDKIFSLDLARKPRTKINSIIQTKDGGYAGAGRSGIDAWVFKLDERGKVEWDKTYGESRDDESYDEEEAYSIIQTKEGGYAVAGRRRRDIWIFKLDERGKVEWDKTFTRSNRKEWSIQRDMVNSFIQTNDGGYVIAGYIDVSKRADSVNSWATWVFKLDERGRFEWDKIFGEEECDRQTIIGACVTEIYSIIQTKDGGYALAGRTNAKSPSAGGDDVWVIKLKEQ